jgi:hypothetical protein
VGMKFIGRLIKDMLVFGFLLGLIYMGGEFVTQYIDPGFSAVFPTTTSSAVQTAVPQQQLVFDASMYPYYDQLNDTQKVLYSQMYTSVENMTPSFDVQDEVTKTDIETVYRCLTCDHPELFWLSNKYNYQYMESTGRIVSVTLQFNETADDIDASKNAFTQACNQILVGALQYDNEYDKEKYVHDALVENITYDINADLNQSAYSGMVNHRTVCAGYARSFQYLMQQLNIPCYYVIGTSEGEDHAWNIVLIDGSFYNVDVTWDACSKENDPYYFFNLDDAAFDVYHTRASLSTSLPNCTSTLLAHKEDSDLYQRIRFTIPK